MNVFIRAIVRIFSFGERLILPLNSAIASLNGTINLSPHENILTIALINIYYLYIIYRLEGPDGKIFCRGLSFLGAKFVLQNEDTQDEKRICIKFSWCKYVANMKFAKLCSQCKGGNGRICTKTGKFGHCHLCTGCKALQISYLQHICTRQIWGKFNFSSSDSEICFFTWQTFVICEAIIELVVDKIISSPEIILKAQVSG